MVDAKNEEMISLLLNRLERISVDSYWAHRASGVRGALLRIQERIENEETIDKNVFDELTTSAFNILNKAAKEKH